MSCPRGSLTAGMRTGLLPRHKLQHITYVMTLDSAISKQNANLNMIH